MYTYSESRNAPIPELIREKLRTFFPHMSEAVVSDLLSLLVSNLTHVREIKSSNRGAVKFDHEEKIIAFGNGFDWLHLLNKALIINPFDPDYATALKTAAKVILSNIENNRIDVSEGVTCMISAPYREYGSQFEHAKLKADDLAKRAYDVIAQFQPELLEKHRMQFLVGVLNQRTREFTELGSDARYQFSQTGYTPVQPNETSQFLLDHNKKQSEEYTSPYNVTRREIYREGHQTEIMAAKCMDGRLNFPLITGLPVGIIQPLRNLGGKFSLGWKALYEHMYDWQEYAIQRGRSCLVLSTYHFSATDPHLGCAGHNYDTVVARRGAERFAREVRTVFGYGPDNFMNSVVIGVNTDIDSLIVHAEDGVESLDLSTFV